MGRWYGERERSGMYEHDREMRREGRYDPRWMEHRDGEPGGTPRYDSRSSQHGSFVYETREPEGWRRERPYDRDRRGHRPEDFDDYSYGQYRREAGLQRHAERRDMRGREGEYYGWRSERHHPRYDEERRRSRDDQDFEQYRGRDYGFSWADGSNDATWREFDRWGNEYSNHARSEGIGWNRSSTRNQHFWSSPDRER